MNALLTPFQYEFFRHGLLAAVLSGALCGLVGVPVVLKRMSYIGHGLSHAVFGGAVVCWLLGLNFYLGAGTWGFIAAWLIHRTARRRQIGADAAIGVVTTASFAVGVALISRERHFTLNFEAALFGSVLGVTATDLWVLVTVFALTAALAVVGYRPLLFSLFDPEVAQAQGVPVETVQTVLSLVMAATIIATLQVLGATLIAATLVIPPITARMTCQSFARMLWLAPLIGAACGLLGMYASWFLSIASGAAIVLFSTVVFMAASSMPRLKH